MKKLTVLFVVLAFGFAVSGCHSGAMRGAGEDVEALGDRMQK